MIKKKPLSLWPAVFIGAILSGLIMGLTLWFQPTSVMAMLLSMLRQPLILVLNYLPIALVLAFFAFLFANVFYAGAATAFLWGGLSLVNRVKTQVRDDPFYPRDFGLIKEAADAAGSYEMDLPWGLAAILLVFILLFIFLGRYFPCKKSAAPKGRRLLTRLICAAVSLAVTVCSIFFLYSSDDLYNSFTVSNRYHITAVYNDLGFPYCFFYNFTTYEVMEPEGFDKNEAAGYENAAVEEPSGGNAHVIMIMNEAFSDVTDHEVFNFTAETDPLKNYHALAAEENSIAGHIVIPTYAGGTANTEYDVLTGMMTTNLNTTSAFRSFNRDLDSLFSVFGANGYRTLYMHPGDSWFYNRQNCMKLLGADEALFAADMENLT
ncbi:MAG: sulfatase-like hydrolase/transferase, partial [Oscillospiraceae bacterium]|nr:sulfatase-like hydrolase/transferase [Oscillospiraceae bacterium]